MLLGRVLGNAVCTIKYADLEGVKLLTVQPLNKKLEPVGRVQVAADVVDELEVQQAGFDFEIKPGWNRYA